MTSFMPMTQMPVNFIQYVAK